MRATMVRFWRQRQLMRLPVPLTGAAALRAGQPCDAERWLPEFLAAIEREAADGLDLLYTMERAWFADGAPAPAGAGIPTPPHWSMFWPRRW